MRRDELRQPLKRRSLAERIWSKRPSLLAIAYVLTISGFAGATYWAVNQPMPFAGEPVVVAKIPAVEEIVTASTDPAPEATDAGPQENKIVSIEAVDSVPEEAEPVDTKPSNGKRYTIEEPVDQEVVQQEASVVISARRPLPAAPIEGMFDPVDGGQLPKVGPGGKRPSQAYARPVSMNVIHSNTPKIAIILGGMGLSEELTARAARDLPADVTLAFAPYGNNLQKQVNKARKDGHEILLQVPMEPIGYPATNPGPKTLLADSGKEENITSLQWHMSRFAGYTGVVNYMGGRFLANEQAIKPVMAELKKRGILFVEDGSMPLTAAAAAAKSEGTQARRAQLVIDTDSDPRSIAANLALLEAEAEANGIAIGTGSGLPTTIDAIREWAKEAGERGIILIPASAAFKGQSG
jgi:uncharacterized protein